MLDKLASSPTNRRTSMLSVRSPVTFDRPNLNLKMVSEEKSPIRNKDIIKEINDSEDSLSSAVQRGNKLLI